MTWARFDWATGHNKKASVTHYQLLWTIQTSVMLATKEALFKIKLLTSDRDAVAPTHTLFTHCTELAFLQELGRAQSCWFKDIWNNLRFLFLLSFLVFSLACSACPCWMSINRAVAPLQRSPENLVKYVNKCVKKPKVSTTPENKRLV